MEIDNVASAAAAYTSIRSSKNARDDSSNSQAKDSGRTILDIIDISSDAQQAALKAQSAGSASAPVQNDEQRAVVSKLDSVKERKVELDRFTQYMREKSEFRTRMGEERHKIIDELNGKSGGLLSGVSFSTDLNGPITNTSGEIHGQSNAIMSFLQGHKADLDRFEQLKNQKFPPYEQWMANGN